VVSFTASWATLHLIGPYLKVLEGNRDRISGVDTNDAARIAKLILDRINKLAVNVEIDLPGIGMIAHLELILSAPRVYRSVLCPIGHVQFLARIVAGDPIALLHRIDQEYVILSKCPVGIAVEDQAVTGTCC